MILALLLAITPNIVIVSANDTTFTYRELVRHAYQANTERTKTERRVPRDPHLTAVLFIGNSLTYFNEMPGMLSAMAAHEERPLLVEQETPSGMTLEDHWLRTDALKRIWSEHWDYVILQERSGRAAMDRGELFHTYLKMFADQVRKSGATPVLFQTWYPGNDEFFRAAAKRANVLLLPVGRAWKNAYDWDGTHPNLFGSYLIACSVYVLVYDKPPVGLRFDFRALANRHEFYDAPLLSQNLDRLTADEIGRAAWNAREKR